MRVGPKYKICKRLGSGIFEKCQTQKFMLVENRKQTARRRGRPKTLSDYGRQLLEKQKVRYTYGLPERQLSKYVETATKTKSGTPADKLIARLEMRLDNVVFRMGLASTRAAARQMVSHGHITVGDRKVTIPSYTVTPGEVIGVREGSRGKTLFEHTSERLLEYSSPSWLTVDPKKMTGTVSTQPDLSMVELPFDMHSVLEFYSR